MKRKFSFNLAPVKIPSKSDARNAKPTSDPVSSHAQTHRRGVSKDSITTLNSPYICRRAPLDPQTERELRIACKLILRNFKPSDHGFTDADPKLDFQGMAKPREYKDHSSGAAQVKVRAPTGAPTDPRAAPSHNAKSYSREKDAATARDQVPTQANTGRRRTDHGESSDRATDVRRTGKSSANDVSRSATMRTDLDSDDGRSLGTPLTSSTDAHHHSGSTAPTSAALTSEISSKRDSRQFETAAAAADAQASEWMRQELEKRRREQPSQPESKSNAPPPTRSKSVRSGIKDYIFPTSSAISRTQSHESLNTMNSQTSSQKDLKRNGSTRGWRSWGLQRKSSSRSSSRPGTSKGRLENQDSDKRPDLNLNRELPPLPSLDMWKEQEQQKKKRNEENRKSHSHSHSVSQLQSQSQSQSPTQPQSPGAHIATVMRAPDQQQQDYAAAVRRHHRRSGSDTLALRYGNSNFAHSSPQIARSASKAQAAPRSKPSPHGPDTSMDFDDLMSAMESTKDFNHQLRLASPDHSTQTSQPIASPTLSPGRKSTTDSNRLVPAPNFSRKISSDISSSQRASEQNDEPYTNTVHVAPSRTEKQKSENRSVFKKVFSGWMSKKEKKDNWMDRLEKDGIKGGVMIQDEAALPPVVRY
ncbi:hypothetical protein B0J11DRAFT_187686 [Dendryphion nanum]|uniref:Uncharacterized protein n=1 Tax=Dendryphion nanum TaxID=256645 RepID=A0A9P9I8P6_9PLEO|nr:hypothetical protein B0J11DRAFT_187686 [Dendryphion nanum]